jgi:hypothetical protein
MTQPAFGPNQRTSVEQILEWVTLVSERAVPASDVKDQEAAAHRAESVSTAVTERAQIDEVPTRKMPRIGAQGQPWRPKDEFDPDIFNRRYHGELAAGAVQ